MVEGTEYSDVYQCHAHSDASLSSCYKYHVWLEYGRNVLIILMLDNQCHAMNKKAQIILMPTLSCVVRIW